MLGVRIYGGVTVVTSGVSNLGVGGTGSHGDRGHDLGIELSYEIVVPDRVHDMK